MTRPDHAHTLAQEWDEVRDTISVPYISDLNIRRSKGAFYVGAAWVYDEIRTALEDNDPTRIYEILRSVERDLDDHEQGRRQ